MARWTWGLFHNWIAVAATVRNRPVLRPDETGVILDMSVPETDVLFRCECGKLKSVMIPGRWTFEPVAGVAASPEAKQ